MRILLIRHAESENNTKQYLPKTEYDIVRNCDPEITEKGKIQAERLGLYLQKKRLKINKVYCSTLVRAIQTADILHKILKTDLEIKVPIHGIGGIHYGGQVGTGKGRTWLNQQFPSLSIPPEVTEEGWWFKDRKETRAEALERAKAFAEEMKVWAREGARDHDECVAFVSHGRFLDLLLSVLMDRKEDSKLKISHVNTGVSAFQFHSDGSHHLMYINGSDHLEDESLVLSTKSSDIKSCAAEIQAKVPLFEFLNEKKGFTIHTSVVKFLKNKESADVLAVCDRDIFDNDSEDEGGKIEA